jgi:ribose transport system ATP-binding protein
VLELRNVSKIFPGVLALDDVSVCFEQGEIHALMGENGAGKSTLMKIFCGIYQPDAGQVLLDGAVKALKSYRDAVSNDISIVNQEIQVIPESTVAENICLDHIGQFVRAGRIQWNEINESAQQYLDEVGCEVGPREKIGRLTAAQKQLIQIAKAISSDSRYLMLDEPTSSLTKYEAERLFALVRKLKEKNVCVIFVSHKVEEILQLCDKVTVLRDGRLVGTRDCRDATREDIVKMMIGRDEAEGHRGFLPVKEEVALEARHLKEYGRFEDVSFQLKKGEILGWYGLVGSGRTELARLIIGERPIDGGEILVNGKPAAIRSIAGSLHRYGIGYVTENRKEEGLMLAATVRDNITITVLEKLLNAFRKINRKREKEVAGRMIDELNIVCASDEVKTETLSGGNQQKVSIAKWIAVESDILIVDEPTVGVDIGAKEYIHDLIWKLASEQGKSIILISSDLPELVSLSRRVMVFMDGGIRGELNDLNEVEYRYEEVSERVGALLV